MKLLATLTLLVFAAQARTAASTPIAPFGLVADPTCTMPFDEVAERAMLYAFALHPDGRPDVLINEAATSGFVSCSDFDTTTFHGGSYAIAPNWVLSTSPPCVVMVVAYEGHAFVDSAEIQVTFGAVGPVTAQPVGALGGVAPLVLVDGGTHVVEWTPLREVDEATFGAGCSRAGASTRGFIVGYNVYALPVASFPLPTLRDFVVSGVRYRVATNAVDWNVADPDGAGGSDLDPTDGLTLRNPDGLPDTGDEVLSFRACPDAGAAHWYRIQPVAYGDPALLVNQGSCASLTNPYVAVDLDGDGTWESLDAASDGMVEFIDPFACGLGLTSDGEILSSLEPGLGGPALVGGCSPAATRACGSALPTCGLTTPPPPPPPPDPSGCPGTVVIGGCDSDVTALCADGTCLTTVVADCETAGGSRGSFVSCLAHELNALKADGLLTGQEKSRILRCAGGRSAQSSPASTATGARRHR